MTNTPEQAKKLWCPMVRIADHCAMWRWRSVEKTDGYCGIAGRPEVMV